jgi:O-antigen ligase
MNGQDIVCGIEGTRAQVWAVLSLSIGLGLAIILLDLGFLGTVSLALVGLGAMVALARVTSMAFSLFGTFLVLLYAGSREFAYLGVAFGDVTIFVSEICLAVTGALLLRNLPTLREFRKSGVCPLPLAAYLLLGCVALARGVSEFGLEAIRDSALCYYAVAFILTVLLTQTWRAVKLLIITCYFGWALAGILVFYKYAEGLGIYLPAHEVVRYAAGSQAVSAVASVGSAVAIIGQSVNRRVKLLFYALGLGQLLVALFLIQHRSLIIALAGTLLVVIYCCLPYRWPIIVLALWCVVAVGLLPVFLGGKLGDLPPIVGQTLQRLETILAPQEDANSHWRIVVWKEALKSGATHPILGTGFGPPFAVDLGYRVDHDIDPHNSYVAIFYRLGIPGILALLFLWVPILREAFLSCRSDPERRLWVGMALSGHVGVAIFAFFNVAFEGPYMGIPFWVSLAIVQQASRVVRYEMADQKMISVRG